ncbi:MAG: hypothetical protein ACRD0E_02880 [Acidimicrobiales bacterium]
MSNTAAVGLGFSTAVPAPTGKVSVSGHGVFGRAEGSAVSWVSVSAGTGISRVRVTFNGMGSDEMIPVQHLAVLAVPGSPAAPTANSSGSGSPQGQVQGLDATGKVVSSVVFSLDSYSAASSCVTGVRQASPKG